MSAHSTQRPHKILSPFSLAVFASSAVGAPFFLLFGPNAITYYGLFTLYAGSLVIWFVHGDFREDFLAISTMFVSVYVLLPQPALSDAHFYFWGASSELNEPNVRVLLLCAVFLGTSASATLSIPPAPPRLPAIPVVELRILPILVIASILVTFAAVFPGILFSSRTEATVSLGAARPFEMLIFLLLPRGVAIGYCMILTMRICGLVKKRRIPLPEMLLLLPGLIYFNPVALSRQALATGVLALFFILSRYRLVDRRWIVGFLPCAALFLAPALSNITRYEMRNDEFPFAPDFDVHQNAAVALQLLDAEGFRWGSHLLASLSTVLPSELKLFESSHLLASERLKGLYDQTNISLAAFVEFFIDFGWVGLFGLTYLVSRALRAVQTKAYFQQRPSLWTIGASCILAGDWLALNRGPFLGNAPVLIVFVIGWTVCCRVALRSRPSKVTGMELYPRKGAVSVS
ncbi:hypothetical protein ACVWWO_006961 [Bradyrhizobium sp. F1.13.1]